MKEIKKSLQKLGRHHFVFQPSYHLYNFLFFFQFLEIFDALRHNESLKDLSMANTTLGDFAAANLACSLEDNKCLEKLNLESNNVSPQTLIKIFEVGNKPTGASAVLWLVQALFPLQSSWVRCTLLPLAANLAGPTF